MAVFSFDDAMCTSGLPAVWALRMRVNKSATGSVMLIVRPSPARLRETWYFAPEGDFADLHARQSKLAIHTARAARDRAALALPRRARVPWHCLKFCLRSGALFRRSAWIANQLLELGTLVCMPLHNLLATSLALDHARLSHSP